ncbi:RNA-binding protein [candidate division WOR-3 bacterium]|nr:RNA-binding protein [candidate division WOR-3 bacterium]
MKLYVGNLPYELNEDELRTMFAQFGEVASVNIISDRVTKRPKGFGFVEMPNNQEAENAMKDLNEKEVKGRKIRVNEARPKEENPRYN